MALWTVANSRGGYAGQANGTSSMSTATADLNLNITQISNKQFLVLGLLDPVAAGSGFLPNARPEQRGNRRRQHAKDKRRAGDFERAGHRPQQPTG